MTTTSPNKNFALLDPATFGREREVGIEVILTFDDDPQEFYDVQVRIDALSKDLEATEIDVVAQILDASSRDLSTLVKISLCYDSSCLKDDIALDAVVDHLCRFSAKYYFQPNQRDDYEQAIVDALGIASRTREFA